MDTTATASRFSRSVTAEYHRRFGLFPHEAAGLRHLFRPRGRKNALVGVYDGEPGGFDVEGGRWQTVCEVHGSILSHETLALARDWARDPWFWCEGCQAHHDG
jgi:hypothetical protein